MNLRNEDKIELVMMSDDEAKALVPEGGNRLMNVLSTCIFSDVAARGYKGLLALGS